MARDRTVADATESSRLQDENRRLKSQIDAQAMELSLLRARFARYETALRGSHVVVYTQDRDLRYTSVSHEMMGHPVADILGRTDEEIWPADIGAAIVALKNEALATGQPRRTEMAFDDAPGQRWHDLHIEPLRSDSGEIVGLTCASVDVTDRKEGEAHLRLLLRELTHRSKNLLAVIQAMARQTARHAGSTESFLNQFSARLQALAASHDLLVRESWYGASLNELIRSQLAVYLDRADAPVSLAGPDVSLKPEAAQSLGLALHELSVNAARFGALSVPEGRVTIVWKRGGDGGPQNALELDWHEQYGPKVKVRRKQGFGSMVIERNLARSLDADVALTFEPHGVRCHVVIPASQFVAL
ncbi:MAG: HWE histidine kinase domain-containing protein [Pseudolabrys sp.]|nr:HWE histidine kinase domain-containing protein [Pseudolabrys sp.]MDP2297052.1 HWE histidine kinase domain-containing protein [Pseudolabrys sp.]